MKPDDLFAKAYALDGAALAEWMDRTTPREILEVANAARSAFRVHAWGMLTPSRPAFPALATLPARERVAIAALLSLHRNGYLREAALREMGPAVPFLLLRCDDIITEIRERAVEQVEALLTPEHAVAFACSLRLVDTLSARTRGGPLAPRISELLSAYPAALDIAAQDDDPLVRLRARELRLETGDLQRVLEHSLADPSLSVQLWAARLAVSKRTNDLEKRALLPILDASRSVTARILALRAHRADAVLEDALLDHQAAVRHFARTLLRARHPDRPFDATRTRALETLSSATAPDALVGALGALADCGLKVDAATARKFMRDARVRVRREAERTVRILDI